MDDDVEFWMTGDVSDTRWGEIQDPNKLDKEINQMATMDDIYKFLRDNRKSPNEKKYVIDKIQPKSPGLLRGVLDKHEDEISQYNKKVDEDVGDDICTQREDYETGELGHGVASYIRKQLGGVEKSPPPSPCCSQCGGKRAKIEKRSD
jgi:hypothetical protein